MLLMSVVSCHSTPTPTACPPKLSYSSIPDVCHPFSFVCLFVCLLSGLRSPHKLKSAVSGCVRECAEAQGKDFGLVATENGYNLYVCGNGGAVARCVVLTVSKCGFIVGNTDIPSYGSTLSSLKY